MNLKTVTIIIPNYNKGKYIKECINSVISQTFKNWELIIIDDHSNDESINILDDFLFNKNIKIFKLKKNKGPSFCRNFGMRISNSKYIAFLDSDDYWTTNKLLDQISFMEKNNYSVSYTDYKSIFEINKKEKITNIKDKFNLNSFLTNTSINTSTLILKKNIIGTLKFKKLDLLEDYIFKCELLKKGIEAYKLNIIGAIYRINKENRSLNYYKNLISLFMLNRKFNNLNFFKNVFSIILVVFNSLKKYGLIKYKI